MSRRTLRLLVLGVIAFVLVAGGLAATPGRTVAASPVKVVIVVGPVESTTSRYKSIARSYAAHASATRSRPETRGLPRPPRGISSTSPSRTL